MTVDVKLTVMVPPEMRRKAKALAAAKGITMSEVVRASLEQFITIASYERRRHPQPYAGLDAELAEEFADWDAASDEALANFEGALG